MATPMNTGRTLEQLEAEYQRRARAAGLDPMQPNGQARGGVALPKAVGGPPMPGGGGAPPQPPGPGQGANPFGLRRTGEQTSALKKALEAEMRGEAQRGPLERSMKQFDEMANRRTDTKVGSPMTGVADAFANIVGAVGQGQTGNREREMNASTMAAKSAQLDEKFRQDELQTEMDLYKLLQEDEKIKAAWAKAAGEGGLTANQLAAQSIRATEKLLKESELTKKLSYFSDLVQSPDPDARDADGNPVTVVTGLPSSIQGVIFSNTGAHTLNYVSEDALIAGWKYNRQRTQDIAAGRATSGTEGQSATSSASGTDTDKVEAGTETRDIESIRQAGVDDAGDSRIVTNTEEGRESRRGARTQGRTKGSSSTGSQSRTSSENAQAAAGKAGQNEIYIDGETLNQTEYALKMNEEARDVAMADMSPHEQKIVAAYQGILNSVLFAKAGLEIPGHERQPWAREWGMTTYTSPRATIDIINNQADMLHKGIQQTRASYDPRAIDATRRNAEDLGIKTVFDWEHTPINLDASSKSTYTAGDDVRTLNEEMGDVSPGGARVVGDAQQVIKDVVGNALPKALTEKLAEGAEKLPEKLEEAGGDVMQAVTDAAIETGTDIGREAVEATKDRAGTWLSGKVDDVKEATEKVTGPLAATLRKKQTAQDGRILEAYLGGNPGITERLRAAKTPADYDQVLEEAARAAIAASGTEGRESVDDRVRHLKAYIVQEMGSATR